MAKFDKSQGFTFVYTDFYRVYKQAQNESKLDSALVIDRQKGRSFIHPMGVVEAEEKALRRKVTNLDDPLSSLRQNLNTLTKAHAKLRFLLQEVDALTKKSSDRK